MQAMLEDEDMKDELKRYQLKQKGEYEEMGKSTLLTQMMKMERYQRLQTNSTLILLVLPTRKLQP